MISPLAVALQGIGYSALLVAVQGFALTSEPDPTPTPSGSYAPVGGGGRRRRKRRHNLRDDEKAFILCRLG